ncbi:MAG TPA: DUF72 domain-containing protein [Aquifex aeolicus]|nr:DUF72 domain-containing protein [Aquifex aeolicus]
MKKPKNIYIGCSGFSYKDWKGTFYPSHIPEGEMIIYYEKYFEVVEINYTYYTMPHPFTFHSFLEKTKRLKFAVKVNQIFTHEMDYTKEDVKKFIDGIKPLLEEEKRFIVLLFQFPESFRYTPENIEYIKKLSRDFAGIDRVIEVRHRSFANHNFYNFVEEAGFSALVNIDAPKVKGLLVGPWVSVGTINYIRLHGRNKEKWHNHREPYQRYDYLYSSEEIEKIRDKILKIYEKKDTYVFFNNHYRGKGALNALQLKELFGEEVKFPKGLLSSFAPKLWE